MGEGLGSTVTFTVPLYQEPVMIASPQADWAITWKGRASFGRPRILADNSSLLFLPNSPILCKDF
jgi:hypothetical protein